MAEVIDVHFTRSSFENRKIGIAILVDLAELYPKGILYPGRKKTESNMKSDIVESVITEMNNRESRHGHI